MAARGPASWMPDDFAAFHVLADADEHTAVYMNGQVTPQYTPPSIDEREDSLPPEQMGWKTTVMPTAMKQEEQQSSHPPPQRRKRASVTKAATPYSVHADQTTKPARIRRSAAKSRKSSYSTESISPSPPSIGSPTTSKGPRAPRHPPTRAEALEKNRQAAHKCRENKKKWVKDLETTADQLAADQAELVREISYYRGQALWLKNEMLRHASCKDSLVNEYLFRAANAAAGGYGAVVVAQEADGLAPGIAPLSGDRNHTAQPQPQMDMAADNRFRHQMQMGQQLDQQTDMRRRMEPLPKTEGDGDDWYTQLNEQNGRGMSLFNDSVDLDGHGEFMSSYGSPLDGNVDEATG